MKKKTLGGIAIAIALALGTSFLIMRPSERGEALTGVDEPPGQLALSEQRGADAASIEDVTGGNDALVAAADAEPMDPLPLPNPAVSQIEPAAPRTETLTVKLGFDEKTEIKVQLDRAKAIVYSWSVEGGEVYVDFHGHDPSKGKNFWVRYEEADGVTARSGSLVAPFSGEHGWYWLNVSQTPVTITLTVTGYQQKLIDHGLLK